MKWIAIFSQTGSEIANIIEQSGMMPDIIISHGPFDKKIDPRIEKTGKLIRVKTKEKVELIIKQSNATMVTLHGYLRIVSPEICNLGIKIYNGHPAPINFYPDLKGKDKQEDQFLYKEKYPLIGTVIHRVTEDLDEGEILLCNDKPNTLTSIEDAYSTLSKMSLELWLSFFKIQYYKGDK